MAKKKATKKKSKPASGEQMDLIDVAPENSKEIVAAAKVYKKHLAARLQALSKEVEAKNNLRELIRKSGAKPLASGKIKLQADGFIITVTPKDELIQVTEKKRVGCKE